MVSDILMLIALTAKANNKNWGDLIKHKHLPILDITPESVIDEESRRAQEMESGKLCPFCAECNLASRVTCRYCSSDFKEAPRRSLMDRFRQEPAWLKEILISVLGFRKMRSEPTDKVFAAMEEIGFEVETKRFSDLSYGVVGYKR